MQSLRHSSLELLGPLKSPLAALKGLSFGSRAEPDPAHALFDAPIEQAIAYARKLLADYETSRDVSFPSVYRLEVAFSTLSRNIESSKSIDCGERRTKLRNALLQVVHLAQVGREWQQDIYNLQHSLYYEQPDPDEKAGLLAAIASLKQFVQQNMADLTKWLRAAERLSIQ